MYLDAALRAVLERDAADVVAWGTCRCGSAAPRRLWN